MMRLKMNGQTILFSLLAVSAPIERLLTVDILGYNFRPVYLIMIGIVLYGVAFKKIKLKAIHISFILLFVAACTINVAFSVQPLVSALNAALAILVCLASFTLFSLLVQRPYLVDEFTHIYVMAAAMWSIVVVAQWIAALVDPSLAYSFLGPFPRVHALTYEPSFLATYLVYPFFVSLSSKPPRPALSMLLFFALLLTLSRTGILAAAIGLFGLLLLNTYRFSQKKFIFSSIAIAATLIFLFMLPPTHKFLRTTTIFVVSGISLQDDTSAKPRLQSWIDAVDIFRQRPLLGFGLGAYGYALSEIKELGDISKPLKNIKTSNMLLEVLAEQGILGGALFAVWWALPLLAGLHNPNTRLPGPIYAYLILSITFLFTQTWWRPYIWLPWTISLAYAYRRR